METVRQRATTTETRDPWISWRRAGPRPNCPSRHQVPRRYRRHRALRFRRVAASRHDPRMHRGGGEFEPAKPAIKHLLSADIDVAPRVITYRELVAQIRAAASLFEEVSRGERPAVAIILPMLPEAHIAGWGASSVGVACQINPFLEMKQIVAIMNAARATTLVTTTSANGRGAWDKLAKSRRRFLHSGVFSSSAETIPRAISTRRSPRRRPRARHSRR